MKKYLFALSFLFVYHCIAQKNKSRQNLDFQITSLEDSPIIDGNILVEKLWEKVPIIENLRQIKPDYGLPA